MTIFSRLCQNFNAFGVVQPETGKPLFTASSVMLPEYNPVGKDSLSSKIVTGMVSDTGIFMSSTPHRWVKNGYKIGGVHRKTDPASPSM